MIRAEGTLYRYHKVLEWDCVHCHRPQKTYVPYGFVPIEGNVLKSLCLSCGKTQDITVIEVQI